MHWTGTARGAVLRGEVSRVKGTDDASHRHAHHLPAPVLREQGARLLAAAGGGLGRLPHPARRLAHHERGEARGARPRDHRIDRRILHHAAAVGAVWLLPYPEAPYVDH